MALRRLWEWFGLYAMLNILLVMATTTLSLTSTPVSRVLRVWWWQQEALLSFGERKRVTSPLCAWFLSSPAYIKGMCPGLHTQKLKIVIVRIFYGVQYASLDKINFIFPWKETCLGHRCWHSCLLKPHSCSQHTYNIHMKHSTHGVHIIVMAW